MGRLVLGGSLLAIMDEYETCIMLNSTKYASKADIKKHAESLKRSLAEEKLKADRKYDLKEFEILEIL